MVNEPLCVADDRLFDIPKQSSVPNKAVYQTKQYTTSHIMFNIYFPFSLLPSVFLPFLIPLLIYLSLSIYSCISTSPSSSSCLALSFSSPFPPLFLYLYAFQFRYVLCSCYARFSPMLSTSDSSDARRALPLMAAMCHRSLYGRSVDKAV